MIDLLGIVALGGGIPPPFEEWDIPFPCHDLRYATVRRAARGVASAVWLSRDEAHEAADDTHRLFVVGDVFHRTDSPGYRAGAGPIDASELLPDVRVDAAATLARVKGSFTLVLVDEASGRCVLHNGRSGVSPFYYARDGDRFLFSTSLAALVRTMRHDPAVDAAALAELVLFNYPVAARSFFEGVAMLRPGEEVTAGPAGIARRRWWDLRDLYAQETIGRNDALEGGAALFHRVVNDAAAGPERLRVSFTSGFDSRAILSVLDRDPADLVAYAFGIPGSLNVSVPRDICARLGIEFAPIYLEHDYEAAFADNAFKAIALSDALSTVERANYPYAFERLADVSPVVLTGLFGSELLRTFQNVGHIVSEAFVRLNPAPDPGAAVAAMVGEAAEGAYFDGTALKGAADGVAADVAELWGDLDGLSEERRFYAFLMLEGLRKYFGAEVHMERPWAVNRFPFFDDEFVELAFRAPFTGVHGRHTDPTVRERFLSQYFYAFVIRRYRPELLPFTTDHGYPPGDVLSRVWPLKVGAKFVARRLRERRTGYREFRTEEWTEPLYVEHLKPGPADDWFDPRVHADLASGAWKANRTEFAKAASLKLWLEAP
ncbi:MAG: hypothetical protein M3323_09895 [Actinomycetota bacterium]|nr:hypothetical protein [Actinomycetota bacterium]